MHVGAALACFLRALAAATGGTMLAPPDGVEETI